MAFFKLQNFEFQREKIGKTVIVKFRVLAHYSSSNRNIFFQVCLCRNCMCGKFRERFS